MRRLTYGDLTVIIPVGEIELDNAEQFKCDAIETCKESVNGLIVDLSEVGYMDSLGIGAVLSVFHACISFEKEMILVIPKDSRIRDLFVRTGIDKVITIRESLDEVIKRL